MSSSSSSSSSVSPLSESLSLKQYGAAPTPRNRVQHDLSPWYHSTTSVKLVVMGVLTLIHALIELVAALSYGSLALFSDGLHNFSDVLALALAFVADRISKKPKTDKLTYGFRRAEILGGLTNGLFLLSMSLIVFLDAIPEFIRPERIEQGLLFAYIAGAGFLKNFIGAFVFKIDHGHSHGHDDHGSHGHSHSHSSPADNHSHGLSTTPSKVTKRFRNEASDPSERVALNADINDEEAGHSYHSEVIHSASKKKHDHKHHGHGHDHDHDNHNHGHKHEKEHNHESHGNSGHVHDHNTWAVFVHFIGDTLSSGLVVIAGLLSHFFPTSKWSAYLDPIASILVCLVIVVATWPLVRSCFWLLMQSVPHGVDVNRIERKLSKVEGVKSVHDLHVWTLVSGLSVASVHVVTEGSSNSIQVLNNVKRVLHSQGVHSSTVQQEIVNPAGDAQCIESSCVKDCAAPSCCN